MKRVLAIVIAVTAVGCGSGSPSAPSTSTSSSTAVTGFSVTNQQVFMTSNLVAFSWTYAGTADYKLTIGSTSGASDVLTANVTGTSYVWTAPRTQGIYYARVAAVTNGAAGTASTEIPVFTLDMRFVIDALFFGSGPMSDNSTTSSVAMWPDGATVTVLVTNESGSVSLDAARTFVSDYLAATSNFISATVNSTATDYHNVSNSALPQNTVVVRVQQLCTGTGVIACANYGPLPVGPGNSFVNINAAPSGSFPGGSVSIAHEIGHSFGLHHLIAPSANRPEFAFLLNPALVSSQLTAVEKNALQTARSLGMRSGWTRAQAVSAGLVFQNPSGS